jgi:hypothetical protein
MNIVSLNKTAWVVSLRNKKNGTRTRDLIAKCRLCRNSFHRSINYIVFRYSITNNSLQDKNRFHVQGNLVKVSRVWESKHNVYVLCFLGTACCLFLQCSLIFTAVLFLLAVISCTTVPVAFHLANACTWTGHLYNILMLSSSNRYRII